MKITGTSNVFSRSLTASSAGAAIRKLNVGQDQPRLLFLGQGNGFGVCARHSQDTMAEALDQRFELHGDERVVFDYQHLGCNLRGELATGFLHQPPQCHHVDIKNARRVWFGKPFERNQKEGLARKRGYARELLFAGQRRLPRAPRPIDRHGIPDLREKAIERNARPLRVIDHARIGNQRFEGCRHIGVAGGLIAGQRAGITAQKGKVLCYRFGIRQDTLPCRFRYITVPERR